MAERKRWSWDEWLVRVGETLHGDREANAVARAIREEKRGKKKRAFWAFELDDAWGPSQGVTVAALNRLSSAGLLSRCPGTPFYAPTMERDPNNADNPGPAGS